MPQAVPPKKSSPPISIKLLSKALSADLFLYSGSINDDTSFEFIDVVRENKARENVALVLCTYGGDPDAAFRIARFLKTHYKRFYLYVFGYCKSAGTLLALGANQIIMGYCSEFGPLDVQLFKNDEITLRTSGLDVYTSLRSISEQAFNFFEDHLFEIKKRSGGLITTKTAADLATSMAVGLLTPITSQIDPLRLGEVQRALNVATEYGKRLGADDKTLTKLTSSYPSHSFIIDYEEVKTLLNARRPNESEQLFELELAELLRSQADGNCLRTPAAMIGVLTEKPIGKRKKGKAKHESDKFEHRKTKRTPARPRGEPQNLARGNPNQKTSPNGEGTKQAVHNS